jgi:WD40 repeat protein
VNFLGPHDEFVTSGSDDGNLFIWRKSTGELVDILEGDQRVVNVIESHPHLPLVAVSGMDTTVKVRMLNTFYYTFLISRSYLPQLVECHHSRDGTMLKRLKRTMRVRQGRVTMEVWSGNLHDSF